MSDVIRRLLEQQDAFRRIVEPLADLIDPLGDTYKQLGIGTETILFLQQAEQRRKLLSGIMGDHGRLSLDGASITQLAEEAERHRALLEGPMEEARRLGLLDQNSDFRRSIGAAIEAQDAYERMFRLPRLDEIGPLTQKALGFDTLTSCIFMGDYSRAALSLAMTEMKVPWLSVEHMDSSVRAFANLQVMGRSLNEHPPFQEMLAASLRTSLGDWRDPLQPALELLVDPVLRSGFYLERGFDPALTDFPVVAFEESIAVAGLTERQDASGAVEGDRAEDGFARAREAFNQLQRFEIALRRFIEKTMQGAYGENWMKSQLPSGMLDKWSSKRDVAVKAGQIESPLIDYADFTDYREIIERRDNWKAVFAPIFGRIEDLRESFQRLLPVRIATMHARIVTLDDRLLLVVETKRVLRAIYRAAK
jgi:hypothetical protein